MSDLSYKKTDLLEKASNEGIQFYTKEEKKKYEDLKKRREQLRLFDSKFKSNINSKEAIVQHEVTDIETLIYDF
jgi:hypothetical protein